jgi:hypothetical protein
VERLTITCVQSNDGYQRRRSQINRAWFLLQGVPEFGELVAIAGKYGVIIEPPTERPEFT